MHAGRNWRVAVAVACNRELTYALNKEVKDFGSAMQTLFRSGH